MKSNVKYDSIEQIEKDIKSITIQGATNVALATVEGMKIALKNGESPEDIINAGMLLANARLNEPMARNAVKYIQFNLEGGRSEIGELINEYHDLIKDAKIKIKKIGAKELSKYDVVLTHCHSSTSTSALIGAAKLNPNFRVVSTETRPRYQGRITSKELFEADVDVTMIVDSVSSSFIVDDSYLPVGAVVIGTDELLRNGDVINKLGSYQMALAAEDGSDKFYVATSLLKLDPDRDPAKTSIEMRDAREVWGEAPDGLKIINPAFEQVPNRLISYFLTEAGVIKPDEVLQKAKELYPWI